MHKLDRSGILLYLWHLHFYMHIYDHNMQCGVMGAFNKMSVFLNTAMQTL